MGRGTRRAADLNRLRRDDPSFARRRRVDDTGGRRSRRAGRASGREMRGEEQDFHGHALPPPYLHKQSQNKEPCAKTRMLGSGATCDMSNG